MKTGEKSIFFVPEISIRRLLLATVVVGLVVLGFWLVFRFHQAFLILFAGIILSVALKPVIRGLQRYGIPPWGGMLLIYALLALLAVLFLVFGAPLIGQQIGTIADELNRGYAQIREGLLAIPNLVIRRLTELLPTSLSVSGEATTFEAQTADETADSGAALRQVMGMLGMAAGVIFQTAAIFILAFFWTLESERIKRSGLLLLPHQRRDGARELVEAMEHRVSTYVSGQLLLAVIIGGLSLAAYLLIGLPNALVLALLMAVMELIPVIGPIIGAIPAVVIGFSVSPATALWVVLAVLIIHQLEANLIGPRVMKRALDMRPLVTLIALAAFGSLFGILGALVALPLASILQLLLDRYVLDLSSPGGASTDRSQVSVIRYEISDFIEDTRKLIRRQESESLDSGEQIEDLIEALAVDLDSLLATVTQEAIER